MKRLTIELHPEIWKKKARANSCSPYEGFSALRELPADYEDLLDLRAVKEQEQHSISLEDVKSEFDL